MNLASASDSFHTVEALIASLAVSYSIFDGEFSLVPKSFSNVYP